MTTATQGAPQVSVLVPSFNHAPFVTGAVQSALDQTEPAIEVLVIDDGSTDDSVARLRCIDDPRLSVVEQENIGLSRTLNRALERARAPWVKFLPSDDMLAPRCLEVELRAATELGLGLVFCLPEIVGADGRPLADPAPQSWFDTEARHGDEILRGLLERNFLSAPGGLFQRDLAQAVGGFDPEMEVAQDYDLWLKLLPRCSARLVPERLVRVRWHGANQSAVATPETEAERARALRRALDDVGIEGWVERFGGGDRRNRAVQGRIALAGALKRSGLGEVGALAERLLREAADLDRARQGGVRKALVRGASAILRRGLWRLRPARPAKVGSVAARSPSTQTPALPPVATGPRSERWLVLDPVPPLEPLGRTSRGRSLAGALARAGVSAAYFGSESPSPASTAERGLIVHPFTLGVVRELLAASPASERVRLLVESPHPEAVALAREAAAMGARIVLDRSTDWPRIGAGSWYEPEAERALIDLADDLVAPERALAPISSPRRRPVHLLPEPAEGAPDVVAAAWEGHANSLRQIVAAPTVTAILVAHAGDPGLAPTLAALVAGRDLRPYRLTLVLVGADVDSGVPALPDGATDDVRCLRCPISDISAARSLGLRATAGEIVAFVSAGATSALAGSWLDTPSTLLIERAEVGAVAFGAAASQGSGAQDASRPPVAAMDTVSRPEAAAWREVAALDGPVVALPRSVAIRLHGRGEALGPAPTREAADDALGSSLRALGYRLCAAG